MVKNKAVGNSQMARRGLREVLDKALDKKIQGYFQEYSKVIIDAVNFGFEKSTKEHNELLKIL